MDTFRENCPVAMKRINGQVIVWVFGCWSEAVYRCHWHSVWRPQRGQSWCKPTLLCRPYTEFVKVRKGNISFEGFIFLIWNKTRTNIECCFLGKSSKNCLLLWNWVAPKQISFLLKCSRWLLSLLFLHNFHVNILHIMHARNFGLSKPSVWTHLSNVFKVDGWTESFTIYLLK